MKDRNKMMKEIVRNVLNLMPDSTDTMYITLEDYEDMAILELEIKLNIKEMK